MTDAIIASVESRHVDVVAKSFYEAKIEDMEAADAIAVGSSIFDPVCNKKRKIKEKLRHNAELFHLLFLRRLALRLFLSLIERAKRPRMGRGLQKRNSGSEFRQLFL